MTRRIAVTVAGALLLTGLTGCAVLTETPTVVTADTPDTAPAAAAGPVERITIEIPQPRSGAPGLKTTGTDWPTILASLASYGQWILANPDPAQVTNVAVPGCAIANQLSRQVAGLLTSRTYLKPSPPVFTTVTGPTPTDPATDAMLGDKATLNVIASRPSEPVISRTGKQVTTVAPLLPARLQITLHRGDDDKWRLCTLTTLDTSSTNSPVPLL